MNDLPTCWIGILYSVIQIPDSGAPSSKFVKSTWYSITLEKAFFLKKVVASSGGKSLYFCHFNDLKNIFNSILSSLFFYILIPDFLLTYNLLSDNKGW